MADNGVAVSIPAALRGKAVARRKRAEALKTGKWHDEEMTNAALFELLADSWDELQEFSGLHIALFDGDCRLCALLARIERVAHG